MGESFENVKQRTKKITNLLQKQYPEVKCSLEFKNRTELFVAVCLSANCSDTMVNRTTPVLFSKFKTFRDYANANLRDIQKCIKPLGLYRNKSKNLKGAARIIVEKHGGKIPKNMEDLRELPGVGRKIANVIQAVAFGIMEGIAVDTHVSRLSQRLSLSQSQNRVIIERDLMKMVPQSLWDDFSLLLIYH